jgi:uncharacterized protein (DUF2062 family)
VDGAPVRGAWRKRKLRELLYRLRIEGGNPARQAAAVALGIFIGCTPLYGLHLALCVLFARLLGLNRVKTYLAAHISTPLLMPFLLFFEVQTGRLVRGKPLLSLRPSEVPEHWRWDARHLSFWHWKSWADLVVGSVVLGVVLAVALGLATYFLVRRGQRSREMEDLIEETAHRYIDAGLIHCELVRGKLRHDPVYFALLRHARLPPKGRLVDLGCGRGIALALLATARQQAEQGRYPPDWPPATSAQLLGIEGNAHAAGVARAGLGGGAAVETAELSCAALPAADAFLLMDVLHYLKPEEQEALLSRLAAHLPSGGVLIVREADAAAGWRFHAVRLTERLMAVLRRDWRQLRRGFHYRRRGDWMALLASYGLTSEITPMGMGTPYANILIRATPRPAGATRKKVEEAEISA